MGDAFVMIACVTSVCSFLENLLNGIAPTLTIHSIYGRNLNLGSNFAKFSRLFTKGVELYLPIRIQDLTLQLALIFDRSDYT